LQWDAGATAPGFRSLRLKHIIIIVIMLTHSSHSNNAIGPKSHRSAKNQNTHHYDLYLVCLPLPHLQASHAFSVAAMGELAAIYAARGDTALAANLSRHLSNVEAAQAMKQSGKLHGNQAWASYYRQSAQPQQRQVIEAAWQRKRDLGLIRQPRGAAAAARRQQQRQQQSGQAQQQQQQDELLGLEFDLSGVVEAFGFSSAAAAAAAEPPAPEA
jgi:hypothetical protein